MASWRVRLRFGLVLLLLVTVGITSGLFDFPPRTCWLQPSSRAEIASLDAAGLEIRGDYFRSNCLIVVLIADEYVDPDQPDLIKSQAIVIVVGRQTIFSTDNYTHLRWQLATDMVQVRRIRREYLATAKSLGLATPDYW